MWWHKVKHYRSIGVHFPPAQAERFGCQLRMCPCGRHPDCPGQAPGGLPPQHTPDDIWNHPYCCWGFVFVTPWNAPRWTPRPRPTQVSQQSFSTVHHPQISVSKSMLHRMYARESITEPRGPRRTSCSTVLRQTLGVTHVAIDCLCLTKQKWLMFLFFFFFICREVEAGPA